MPLDLDVRLAPGARAPQQARRSLEPLRASLDDSLVDEAVLLVSEVVTNAVRHAGLDRTDVIEVRIRGSSSRLRVDVVDPGSGFDPARLRPADGHGGWGLWLLDRLAPRWGVERNDVTRVWFELGPAVSPVTGRGMGGVTPLEGGLSMGEKMDKTKGHVKEAVGDLTDDERLEREGKLDQASGSVKGMADDAKDKVDDAVDAAKEKMRGGGA